jgi:hypothetical protein
MGEGLTDEEILAWMRAHAAEHTIRGMVLAGEMVEHYQREICGDTVAGARLYRLALADQVQAEVDAAQQAREQGEG